MTDDEINRAIAEACGWKEGVERHVQNLPLIKVPPNYCTDLNAMHEAEKTLNAERWQLYAAFLFKATSRPQHATAQQRAEAFLRALGKWEEVQP